MESMEWLNRPYIVWENSNYPELCRKCEYNIKYIIIKIGEHEKECKICSRPFTVLHWYPRARGRFKKTEICQTCNRLNNVCETCLFALYYGLPIQERDTSLDLNSENYIQNMERELRRRNPDSVRFQDIIYRIYSMNDYDPERVTAVPTFPPSDNNKINTSYSENLGSHTERNIRNRNELMRGLPDAFSEFSKSFFNLKFGNIPLPTMPRPPSLMVLPMFRPLLIPNSIFNAPVTDLHLWLHLLLPITLGVEVLVTLRRLLSIIRLWTSLG